ncbi:dihydropteroate synthase-like protein [Candidatus Bathyarchaeota archaeon]|nr:dihydropteroate synthase-like protein [Candidatus Bathyarchaeota archaeon]
MKTLLVTGLMAEGMVREAIKKSNADCEVYVMPLPVASLLSPSFIARTLEKENLSGIDLILIPGLIKGEASIVEEATGVKTRKGPKSAADLPIVLDAIRRVELSPYTSADELVERARLEEAEMTLCAIERESMRLRSRRGAVAVGSGAVRIFVGPGFRMRVLAEIVDASIMPDGEIQKIARLFEASGADIIDIGMVAGGGHPEDSARAVGAVKRCSRRPVSIDTGDPAEMEAAVESGVDLILSLNLENMEEVAEFAAATPVVVTSAGKNHRVPEYAEERVAQLNENIKRARSLGFSKIIADPILNPLMTPNMTVSLLAYLGFRRIDSETPMLFGAGNVTELMDADSIGANMLLAGIAAEVGADILLTTEASVKTRGSVAEMVKASRMIALAKARKTAPEDVGVDLLVMKEKRWREEAPGSFNRVRTVSTRSLQASIRDPRGSFKILIDRGRGELILLHHSRGEPRPDLMIRDDEPDRLIGAAIRRGLVSRLEHAYYLGKELEKAKIALETGKSYLQDSELLFGGG